ncbi:hypothetical protein [Marivita sp. XM-24bin2]|uniref:hypothetical protein n=1 Tax=Marivita sp. XM-24bin2 TaxID=2133951 RepID=UPI000D7B2C76|nr:hypothetical protein [Marivita sp. XM-24bin2]PWL33827.1 MAG: hypothetical protein DCO97_17490 [Marivita sp. XM-24bin2]
MCDYQKKAKEATGSMDMGRHGWSPGGSPLTWTGRPVSPAEWAKLSTWEKHGPDGRLWCGCCGAWVEAETALAHPSLPAALVAAAFMIQAIESGEAVPGSAELSAIALGDFSYSFKV